MAIVNKIIFCIESLYIELFIVMQIRYCKK
jgi:hypothetical protein